MADNAVQVSKGKASQDITKEMEGLLHEMNDYKENVRLERSKNSDSDSEFILVCDYPPTEHGFIHSEYPVPKERRGVSSHPDHEYEMQEDTERSQRKNPTF